MVSRSPLHSKYSEKQLLHLYSELTSDHGALTKRDWLSLFHHVEVRADPSLSWIHCHQS
jgi:hypothetical protein